MPREEKEIDVDALEQWVEQINEDVENLVGQVVSLQESLEAVRRIVAKLEEKFGA
jgi:hypothetical protein